MSQSKPVPIQASEIFQPTKMGFIDHQIGLVALLHINELRKIGVVPVHIVDTFDSD